MKKYVVIYHAPAADLEQVQDAPPEQIAEAMKPWMAWAESSGDGLVGLGTPLVGGQKVTKSGTSPSDKGVVGYSILQAENMDAAQALLKAHPHLEIIVGAPLAASRTPFNRATARA